VRGVRLARRAELDVAQAAEYLDRETGNPEFGNRLVGDLQRVMYLIAENPWMGRARPELQKGLRAFPHGSHTIFWRPSVKYIEIIRVLHQRQDRGAGIRDQTLDAGNRLVMNTSLDQQSEDDADKLSALRDALDVGLAEL
jgi:toxin ParE1/3/4